MMVTKNMLMVLGAIFVFFSGVYMAPVMSAKANEGVVSMTYIAISNCTSHDGKLECAFVENKAATQVVFGNKSNILKKTVFSLIVVMITSVFWGSGMFHKVKAVCLSVSSALPVIQGLANNVNAALPTFLGDFHEVARGFERGVAAVQSASSTFVGIAPSVRNAVPLLQNGVVALQSSSAAMNNVVPILQNGVTTFQATSSAILPLAQRVEESVTLLREGLESFNNGVEIFRNVSTTLKDTLTFVKAMRFKYSMLTGKGKIYSDDRGEVPNVDVLRSLQL